MSYKIDGVINTNRSQSTLSGPNIRILPNSLVPSGTNYDSSGNTYGKVELLLNRGWESESAHKEGVYVRDENGYLSLTGAAGGTARNVFTSENGTLSFNELGTSSFLSIRGKENEEESRYFLTTNSPFIPQESLYINNNTDPMFATIPNNVLSTSLTNSNGQSVLMFKAAKTGLYTVDVTVDYDNNDYGTNSSNWSTSPTPVVSGSRQLRIGIVPGSSTVVDSLDDTGCTVIHEFNDQPIPDAALKQTQNVSLMVKVNNAGDFIAYDVAALDIDSDNVAFNVVLFQVSQPAAEAVAGNGGGSSYDQSLNATDAVTFSSLSTEEIKTDTLTESTDGSGVTIDGVLLKDGVVQTDTVDEKTADTGVTIDGVLLKDGAVQTDMVNEQTDGSGVTIDGVLLKDGVVHTDTVDEKTADTGVTIDGVLLKDGAVQTDIVSELTDGSGVTIDGVLLKDGAVQNLVSPVSETDATSKNYVDVADTKLQNQINNILGSFYIQMGEDIDGEASGDFSGWSVSLSNDGTRVAIGAMGNDGSGNQRLYSGHVRVYDWIGSSWVQLGSDIDGESGDDNSGQSVSISSDGSRIAIGASNNDDNGILSGHVRIYNWSGSDWIKMGSDIDGEAYDESGWSVSMSSDGSRVAIGGPWNSVTGHYSGRVTVYAWNESGSDWVKLGDHIYGKEDMDQNGCSVSMSDDGSRVAIGAYGNDNVRVYYWNDLEERWIQLGSDIEGEASTESGWSISLSGDGNRLAIGAALAYGNGWLRGHARIYEWSGSDWAQLGEDIEGEADMDQSGESISLSSDGSTVVIGAWYNDGNGNNSGHVRIYVWSVSESEWVQVGLDIDGEAAGDESGVSISISSDGSRVAIGSCNNDGNGINSGHVRVYEHVKAIQTDFINQLTPDAGVIIDGVLLKDGVVQTDTVDEKTADAGVTIDGVLLKDGAVQTDTVDEKTADTGVTIDGVLLKDGAVQTDSIGELTDGSGVTIDGVLLKDGAVQTDTVSELTDGSGVTIDGVLLKDGAVQIDGVLLKDGAVQTDTVDEKTADTGVTIDGVLLKDGAVQTDSIGELTDGSGVTIDGVLLKDGAVQIDMVSELTDGSGVTIDGVLLKDGAVQTDTVDEKTADAGVTIDGVLLKDGAVQTDIVSELTDGSGVTVEGTVVIRELGDWSQKGPDLIGESTSAHFGRSVSLSDDGTVLAVGADEGGYVSVFDWDSKLSSWTQRGENIYNETNMNNLGYSVSLSSDGSIVAIGSPSVGGNGIKETDAGYVRVYEWDSSGSSWVQKGDDIDGEAAADNSGYSVSLSSDGKIVAIGAHYNDGNGTNSGHVRVYYWDSSSSWLQKGSDIDGEAPNDQSGVSVSLSSDGSIVALGASGQVKVYEWDGVDWQSKGTPIYGFSINGDSGYSVGLSSDGLILAVGAAGDDTPSQNSGRVQVFEWKSGAWSQIGVDINGLDTDGYNGWSVSLSSDGKRLAVGAFGPNQLTGSVTVWDWDGLNWSKSGNTYLGSHTYEMASETSLSGDGTVLAIGGRGYSTSKGRVRVFNGPVRDVSVIHTDAVYSNIVNEQTIDTGVTVDGVLLKDGVVQTDTVGELTDGSGVTIDGVLLKDGVVQTDMVSELTDGSGVTIDGVLLKDGSVQTDTVDEKTADTGVTIDGVLLKDGAVQTDTMSELTDGSGVTIDGVLLKDGSIQTTTPGSDLTIEGTVMTRELSHWDQKGSDITSVSVTYSFGKALSMSDDGTVLAIGAYLNDDNGVDAGMVQVWAFDETANSWTQRGSNIQGEAAEDRSGFSVSLSSDGTILAIGAVHNSSTNSYSGHVRVYEWDGSTWNQRGNDIDGESPNDESGYSVSLSSDGSIVAIGAKLNDGSGNQKPDSGHVRVYNWNTSTLTWDQIGQDIDGESTYNRSGHSVSLSSDGSIVAIGAKINDGNSKFNSGHVRVYEWSGSAWVQKGADIDGAGDYDYSGHSVSLSSDGLVLAIGIPYKNNPAQNSGMVKVYEWNGTGWALRGSAISENIVHDAMGISVSLSNDGTRVAIGSERHTLHSGCVRVWEWDGSKWSQISNTIRGPSFYDRMSIVSLSGDGSTVATGAPDRDFVKVFSEPVRDVAVVESKAFEIDYVNTNFDNVTNGQIEKYILSGGDCLEGQPLSYDYSVTGEVKVKPFDTTPTQMMYAGIAMSDATNGSVVRVTKNLAYTRVRIQRREYWNYGWTNYPLYYNQDLYFSSLWNTWRLTDSGGTGGNYNNNENYTTNVYNNSGVTMYMNVFTYVSEGLYNDRLTITFYDSNGNSKGSLPLFTGTEEKYDQFTISSGERVSFNFVSDGSVVNKGWEIYLTAENTAWEYAVLDNRPTLVYKTETLDKGSTVLFINQDSTTGVTGLRRYEGEVKVGVAMEYVGPSFDSTLGHGQLVLAKNINVDNTFGQINGAGLIDTNGSYYTTLYLNSTYVYANNSYIGSDSRIKKDVVVLDDGESFDIIERLNPVKYRYTDQDEKDVMTYGFIAQEVRDVLPTAVKVDSSYNGFEDFHWFKKDVVWTVSVSAIQELIRKHSTVRADHDGLKAEHDSLKAEHDSLKAEHDGLKTEHDGLKTEHDGLKADNDALKTEHDGLKTEHGGLKTEHDSLKTEHGGLKTEFDALKTSFNLLLERVTALEQNNA